jgi:glycosyltransferase involved in cell wall biosynthesis
MLDADPGLPLLPKGMDAMGERTIRVASIPSRDENRYLELFYGALAPHGVELVDGFWLDKPSLLTKRAAVDLIHIQWCPELLWTWGGKSFWKKLRGVMGLWRDLRLARRQGFRIVWTVHDIESHEGGRFLDRWGHRLLARAADLILAHSERVPGEVLRRYGGDPAKMMVLPHGNYDGAFPAPAPQGATLAGLGFSGDRKTLVCCGGVRRYKGLEVAIDAMRLLGSGYRLIIAGYPLELALGQELQERCRGLENVHLLLRRLTQQEVADLTHAADCVLLPYRRITGSGALLTTTTLGRGVVASDLPFFRDTLAFEPDAGVLFPAGSPEGLARGVEEFFGRPVGQRHAAARRLADRFPWDEVVLPYVSWLRQEFPDRQTAGRAERIPAGS